MSNRRKRLGIVAALWIGAFVAAPTVVTAADSAGGGLRAELEGEPIPATEAANHFCHDLAYPLIRCFRSEAALQASVTSLAATASVYVTIYSDASYGGSYAHLSQDYDGLWTIGWNDRISSFKARNGASGRFYGDWYAGGHRYNFCCNTEVPVLGSYDNTFSSVYRN